MKSLAEEIVQKMEASVYADLNVEFIISLTNESERGAILIGASKVEEYLKKIVKSIIPKNSKKYQEKLFQYPGALSSFSGNIELLFAFRVIDESFYNSLNALRKIRNDAAHSSNEFKLENNKDRLQIAFAFEEHFDQIVDQLATDNLISWKKRKIKEALNKSDVKGEEFEKLYEQHSSNLASHPSVISQMPIWKLSYCLTFICIKAILIEEHFAKLTSGTETWLDLR